MSDILTREKKAEERQIHRRSLIAAVKRLHKEGQKAKEIADYLGVAESTVRNILFKKK